MNLITGRTGTDHVLARHDALVHKTALGSGDFVLKYRNQFAYTPQDASHIYLGSGALVMQGRLCENVERESVEIPVCSGSSLKRKCMVVAEYTIDQLGIENVETTVIAGDEASNTYIEPVITYKDGEIDNGEIHQMSLYAVYVDGFSIDHVEKVFKTLEFDPMTFTETLDELRAEVDQELDDMEARVEQALTLDDSVVTLYRQLGITV